MKKYYVVYKGIKYNSGDTINILRYTDKYGNTYRDPRLGVGIFLDCDEEKDEYRFVADGKTYCVNKICFFRTICDSKAFESEKSHYANGKPRKATFKDELNIDGLFIAWIWYILIMLILVIFNDRIFGWIGASIIFFNYRDKKLKEAGYR